ncbi:methionyl-tRNA formyltransferase [Halorussus salinus]|uniref:methionyl-tRNA formyltransferase n=1 Tax=Halorussus salinus TaxID=1364935 RepID=UPI00109234FD|nr:formyltransferase family protein [Halorussus salinus]
MSDASERISTDALATEESDGSVADQSDDPLEILVVTVDEYYYVPKFLRGVLDADDVRVVGITAMSPTLGTESTPRFAWRLYRTFGPRVFAKHVGFYAKHALLDAANRRLGRGSAYSPRTLAERNDIEYRHVADVNDPEYVGYAESLAPDVVVSVAATQKFESGLLGVPDEAAINLHSSLLPEYRGVSPSFWTLRNGESETGVTVHLMDEEIDTGDVLVQRPLSIRDDDTLHSLNERVAERGSDLLLDALRGLRDGEVDPTPIDPDEGSYYSLPDRSDVEQFLDRGRRFY